MASNKSVVRFLFGPVPAAIISLLLLFTLFLLTSAAQHAKLSGEFYFVLLGVNILGILTLSILIAANVLRLYRQLRAKVLGSRLTLRMVAMFVLLVVAPITVVYYFSVQFLSKGVDSWFDVKIDKAVDDALLLGATTLEAIKQEGVEHLVEGARRLESASNRFEVIPLLNELSDESGYIELSMYTQEGRFIASSYQIEQFLIPSIPGERILSQVGRGREYVGLEPISGGGQQLRIAVPVRSPGLGVPDRVLQALQLLPSRYAELAHSVESVSAQYKQMIFFRGPLKFSLILTLTLVALVATLLAVWAAIFISRRMMAPLRDLAEGTRAVAAGDYGKELPVNSTDELGVLVRSFNDMTKQINKAQHRVRTSQREAENQRTYLETVLGHLSSGVMSFDNAHKMRTSNSAVTQILGLEFESGLSADRIKEEHPNLEPLFSVIEDSMTQQKNEWQSEVTIFGSRGRQVLILRGTKLTGRGGCVVVFDDITDLIQAQRDAAWGEVARRLAHEIKNPLTPIQLSAERIRRKYLGLLEGEDRATLDRATRTIVQQVQSMEEMVNAFSIYAQPVRMELNEINLNQLVTDVSELYKRDDRVIDFRFDLKNDLPLITADARGLRQVLNNLLINAQDALASTTNPAIVLSTRSVQSDSNNYIELTVQDNGPGIPEDLLGKLFEPYVTTKAKGTGLGLAIVKRIVEEHGGAIWVESQLGDGAKTTVRLPVSNLRADNMADIRLGAARTARTARAAGERG
jgi:nitrogen fixation/metabolism regulation signal transduction histidine kinase